MRAVILDGISCLFAVDKVVLNGPKSLQYQVSRAISSKSVFLVNFLGVFPES